MQTLCSAENVVENHQNRSYAQVHTRSAPGAQGEGLEVGEMLEANRQPRSHRKLPDGCGRAGGISQAAVLDGESRQLCEGCHHWRDLCKACTPAVQKQKKCQKRKIHSLLGPT